MWASFLLNAYIEHANIQYADENPPSVSDTSQRGTTLRPPKATPAEQGKDGAAGVDQTAPSENDSVVPDKVEIPGTPSKNLKYVDQNIVPKHFVPFIIAIGGLCGLLVAFFITFALRFVTQEAFERFFPALVSVLLAMAVGMLLAWYIVQVMGIRDQTLQIYIQATLVIVFFFIGVNLGLTRTSSWENLVRAVSRKTYEGRNPKLMDTSVIIDGRVADICKAGFIDGTIIVPRFVLQELQSIADSSDTLRRARGRRGLDVLKQLQAPDSGVSVEVVEDDPQHVHTVDAKLVALAKDIAAKVITNDQNLLKVAQIEGVSVMNIHDLANALKTVVLA
ncbi:MAG: PIN/TRAM domain-containing protein, partial [Patescibacteria group bacterium]